jgi:hypothetical protein
MLTHPACTGEMARHVFGDVHMLSHLMGATNRADIRRLRELEMQNAALAEQMETQHRQDRAALAERDETIRRHEEALARKLTDEKQLVARAKDAENFLEVIRELEKRLDEEIAHRLRFQQKADALALECEQSEIARADAERERDGLRQEIAAVEAQINGTLLPDAGESSDTPDLAGLSILYVGGRANQVPQLRALVERMNGTFAYHDGGIEQSATLLPGLISRADVALFPIDCVSHDAAATVKRTCDQTGTPYLPLRTASLACLLSALIAFRREPSPAPTLQ